MGRVGEWRQVDQPDDYGTVLPSLWEDERAVLDGDEWDDLALAEFLARPPCARSWNDLAE